MHDVRVEGLLPSELASKVANMRYDALARFLDELHSFWDRDGRADHERGRIKLGLALQTASGRVLDASKAIERVWNICEPYMK